MFGKHHQLNNSHFNPISVDKNLIKNFQLHSEIIAYTDTDIKIFNRIRKLHAIVCKFPLIKILDLLYILEKIQLMIWSQRMQHSSTRKDLQQCWCVCLDWRSKQTRRTRCKQHLYISVALRCEKVDLGRIPRWVLAACAIRFCVSKTYQTYVASWIFNWIYTLKSQFYKFQMCLLTIPLTSNYIIACNTSNAIADFERNAQKFLCETTLQFQ